MRRRLKDGVEKRLKVDILDIRIIAGEESQSKDLGFSWGVIDQKSE